ncbi:MAG: EamA family transporter, partial [Nocardia sp.]|nr:EamA family transporter [Nocardia sp.]
GATMIQPQMLAWGAAVAILSAAVPYSLEMAALERISAATAGVLLSLEPVIAAIAGLLVLDETLSIRRSLGIAVICVATATAIRHANTSANTRRPTAGSPHSAVRTTQDRQWDDTGEQR